MRFLEASALLCVVPRATQRPVPLSPWETKMQKRHGSVACARLSVRIRSLAHAGSRAQGTGATPKPWSAPGGTPLFGHGITTDYCPGRPLTGHLRALEGHDNRDARVRTDSSKRSLYLVIR